MNKIYIVILFVVSIIGSACLGYFIGNNQALDKQEQFTATSKLSNSQIVSNSSKTSSTISQTTKHESADSDADKINKIELPETPDLFEGELVASELNELEAFQQALQAKHDKITEQMDAIQASNTIALDIKPLTTTDLIKLAPPEEVLSSGIDAVSDSPAGSNQNVSMPNGKRPVDKQLKFDVQKNAGIAPVDIEAAFNVENRE